MWRVDPGELRAARDPSAVSLAPGTFCPHGIPTELCRCGACLARTEVPPLGAGAAIPAREGFQAMGVRLKFNLVLAVVFGLGLAVSGVLSRSILEANARDEVVRSADLMMSAAMAVRSYTNREITPHLELQLMRTFLPRSLPAFAATETFNALREQRPEYSYKEAVLKPTNPRNKALDWEADIISEFRNEPQRKEFRGSRETAIGRALY